MATVIVTIFFWIFLRISETVINPLAHVVEREHAVSIHHTESKSFLSGHHLILGTIEIAPYVIIQYYDDEKKKMKNVDGFVPQIIKWMADKYNFTYEYTKPPDNAYGAFVNGSWNGLVGMTLRGEIDIAVTSLSVTYPRSLVVDFTLAFLDDPMSILIPFPKLDSTITGIVKPFQYEVWIGIIISLLLASIILWLISQLESSGVIFRNFKGKTKLFSQFWFLFRAIANPNEIINFTLATRLVVASWCLVTVVLVNTYNSCLVSYLMAPKFAPWINTVDDLADSKEIQFTVLKHTSTDTILSSATSGALAKIGNSLRAHPENYLTSLENILELVATQHKSYAQASLHWATVVEYIFIFQNLSSIKSLGIRWNQPSSLNCLWLYKISEETAQRMNLYNDFKATNQCRLTVAKEPLYSDNRLAFALLKRSPLTNIFNNELVQLRQFGLLNHWTNSYLPKPDRCTAQLTASHLQAKSNKSLTINYLSSAFLLYGVGAVVSISSFLLEIFSKMLHLLISASS